MGLWGSEVQILSPRPCPEKKSPPSPNGGGDFFLLMVGDYWNRGRGSSEPRDSVATGVRRTPNPLARTHVRKQIARPNDPRTLRSDFFLLHGWGQLRTGKATRSFWSDSPDPAQRTILSAPTMSGSENRLPHPTGEAIFFNAHGWGLLEPWKRFLRATRQRGDRRAAHAQSSRPDHVRKKIASLTQRGRRFFILPLLQRAASRPLYPTVSGPPCRGRC